MMSARSISVYSFNPSKPNFDGHLIQTRSHKKDGAEASYLNNLRYVQSIQFSKLPTWVMKFSEDNRFLATGGKDGVLRIWEVFAPEDDIDHLKLIKDEPFREYTQHTKDIVDISWNTLNKNCVLTASHDKSVILWNIEDSKPIQIYTHSDIVTSVSFKPGANIFATGSFDKNVRFWSIQHKRVINWVDTYSVVTAVQFSTDGERLVSGNMNGECYIFDTKKNNLVHLSTIICKNRKGFFSKGRKVVDIKFT